MGEIEVLEIAHNPNDTVFKFLKALLKSRPINSVAPSPIDWARMPQQKTITFFLGAGVSFPYGIPNWGNLISELYLATMDNCSENLLKARREVDRDRLSVAFSANYLRMARFVSHRLGQRLRESCRAALYRNLSSPTGTAIEEIAQWSAESHLRVSYVTYNYDDLLEQALDAKGVPFLTVYDQESLKKFRSQSATTTAIYHVHGYLPRTPNPAIGEHDLVLSEEQYNQLYGPLEDRLDFKADWRNQIQAESLCRDDSTSIFVGFSLDDPNTRRILDCAKARVGNALILRAASFPPQEEEVNPSTVRLRLAKIEEEIETRKQEVSELSQEANLLRLLDAVGIDPDQYWTAVMASEAWKTAVSALQSDTVKIDTGDDDSSFGLTTVMLRSYDDIAGELCKYRELLR